LCASEKLKVWNPGFDFSEAAGRGGNVASISRGNMNFLLIFPDFLRYLSYRGKVGIKKSTAFRNTPLILIGVAGESCRNKKGPQAEVLLVVLFQIVLTVERVLAPA